MKVRELLNLPIYESVHTLSSVRKIYDLIDSETGQYYTGEVNVTGNVYLAKARLKEFPVKFGTVSGSFDCTGNHMTSLEGAPRKVGSNFNCADNEITSLEGLPQEAGGYVDFGNNKITSLEGIHKIIKKMNGTLYIEANQIKSGGIGILLIEGVDRIFTALPKLPAFDIIEKYLGQGKKGLLLCQEELIEAGYEEFAKL